MGTRSSDAPPFAHSGIDRRSAGRADLLRGLTAFDGSSERDADAVCRACVRILADHSGEVQFALIYVAVPPEPSARLAAAAGAQGTPLAPEQVDPRQGGTWPVLQVLATGQPVLVDTAARSLAGEHAPARTVAAPFGSEDETPIGVAIIGLARHGSAEGEDLIFSAAIAALLQRQLRAARLREKLADLESMRVHAEEANRMKDEFLSNVSHELRAPLNAIAGWVYLLKQGALDDQKRRHALDIIERNTRSQAQIISDLLDASRMVSGAVRLERNPVAVAEVASAAIEAVRGTADNKGVRLEQSLQHASGIVSGDRERLRQVLWNLLANAIKFTPRDGVVRVTTDRRDGQVEVVVSDTGRGIHPEFLPYVFDRFRQGDATIRRSHGGLGLGLAIVRYLVELHGGQVRAESGGEDRGATFTVALPLVAFDAPEAPPARDAGAVALTGVRVLVVDDDPDAREINSSVLRAAGADVRVGASAREAIATFDAWRPQVLLSDIGMPEADGYALIRAIRQRPAKDGGSIAAAAVTAFARTEDRVRAFSAGYQAHLAKPIAPADLVAVVAQLALARA